MLTELLCKKSRSLEMKLQLQPQQVAGSPISASVSALP